MFAGATAATAFYVENDIRAKNRGYNLLLDKVFHNNVDRYEECGLFLTYANGVYAEYGTTNMYRMPGGNSRQSLSNNQSVQKLKAQNSQSGTSGENAESGSGSGILSNGGGGQKRAGVQFGGNQEAELFLPDEYYKKLDDNIASAIAARDAEVARIQTLSKTQQSKIATVVAGVDIRTGKVYVGIKDSRIYRGNATCAEDIVFRGLGGNTNANIIMTPAVRPRNNEVIPVCARCQTKYPKNQFVKGTMFQ